MKTVVHQVLEPECEGQPMAMKTAPSAGIGKKSNRSMNVSTSRFWRYPTR
jgi:hypothetical protein